LLLVIALLSGCNASRVFIASSGDYSEYRRVRLAESADERMAAAWHYLRERPDGRYAERLRRYFRKAEPAFYEVRRRSPAGLESYLAALPDGPHADEALRLLIDARVEARGEAVETLAARATSLRLVRQKAAREEAADVLDWWLAHLLDRELWKAPFDEAPSDLIVKYRLALPAAVCGGHLAFPRGQHCIKSFSRSFVVRGEDGNEERSLDYEVEIELDDDWRLHRAKIIGMNLFVAAVEADKGQSLGRLDQEQMASFARRALDELPMDLAEQNVLCTGGGRGDGRWVFDCEGVTLVAAPGLDGGADVLTFTRTGAAPVGGDVDYDAASDDAGDATSDQAGEEPEPVDGESVSD
jgi:hypothetical protein